MSTYPEGNRQAIFKKPGEMYDDSRNAVCLSVRLNSQIRNKICDTYKTFFMPDTVLLMLCLYHW